MAKATLPLWHSLTQYYKKGTPVIHNATSQKWHVTKATSHKNGISKFKLFVFRGTTNTLLLESPATIRHKLEKLDFKIS